MEVKVEESVLNPTNDVRGEVFWEFIEEVF